MCERQYKGQSWDTASEFVRNTVIVNDLCFLRPHAQSSVPGERAEHPESEQLVEVLTCNDQWDGYSSGESGDMQ